MRMRRLHPGAVDEVDTLDAYAVPAAGAHLRVNMVTGLDGAAAVDGRVGGLTGPADQALLHQLRALCDVLLVGAGTVRAEGYGPLELTADEQRRRVATGQAPMPRTAVVTRTLDLDLTAPVFTAATARPLLVTCAAADSTRVSAASSVADVVVAGSDSVDLREARDQLAAAGLTRVLSEGGPRTFTRLLEADVVDEVCLAIAPVLTAGRGPRITDGALLDPLRSLELGHVLERDGFLFLRYVRTTTGSTG